jgi:hypothetical protein
LGAYIKLGLRREKPSLDLMLRQCFSGLQSSFFPRTATCAEWSAVGALILCDFSSSFPLQVYLFLKTVAETTDSAVLIIVTQVWLGSGIIYSLYHFYPARARVRVQSLVKDMFNDVALYKGNALRVLSAIVDVSMLGQLERYFKQVRAGLPWCRRCCCRVDTFRVAVHCGS